MTLFFHMWVTFSTLKPCTRRKLGAIRGLPLKKVCHIAKLSSGGTTHSMDPGHKPAVALLHRHGDEFSLFENYTDAMDCVILLLWLKGFVVAQK